ncbi:MAG: porin family protein [Pseudolabrys sp.]|nr:porin family protein [Pseudolabrys sp.]
MTLRKITLGIFAALLAAPLAANAADLPRYKAPSYVAPAAFSWSGLYVGAVIGYGFGRSNWEAPAPGVAPKPAGFLAGGTIGYNIQTGSIVWGIEGDLSYSGMKDSLGCTGGTCEMRDRWLGTARARIGYGGWGSFLPYLTAGAAFGGLEAIAPGGTTSSTRFGWTIGAGVEYAIFSAWSVKAEYLYVDLGSFTCGTCGPPPNNVSFNSHVVRAGVNYRF